MENYENLSSFDTYEDYLDSFLSLRDVNYLGAGLARAIIQLNFSDSCKVLNEKQFHAKKAQYIRENKSSSLELLCSNAKVLPDDPFVREMAARERENLINSTQTIIFIICKSRKGHIISGYIDYAENLRRNNWCLIFNEKMKLRPETLDLSYYDWNNNDVHYNSTNNFNVIVDEKIGVIFRSKHDQCLINVDPKRRPGLNTTRTSVLSNVYEAVILFDHDLLDSSLDEI